MNSFGERVGRRAVLHAGIALGIELGLCGQALSQKDPASQRPKEGDLFVKVGDPTSSPLRAADGVVAYTAICTHAGCEVTEWVPEEQLLYCPCHESKFEPKDGANVVDGPAPRMLPALPLKLVEGKLAVAQPFTAPVAFEVQ